MDLRKGWNFASMLNFQIETAIFKDGVLYNFNDSKIKSRVAQGNLTPTLPQIGT